MRLDRCNGVLPILAVQQAGFRLYLLHFGGVAWCISAVLPHFGGVEGCILATLPPFWRCSIVFLSGFRPFWRVSRVDPGTGSGLCPSQNARKHDKNTMQTSQNAGKVAKIHPSNQPKCGKTDEIRHANQPKCGKYGRRQACQPAKMRKAPLQRSSPI